jgi:hypothetical protein
MSYQSFFQTVTTNSVHIPLYSTSMFYKFWEIILQMLVQLWKNFLQMSHKDHSFISWLFLGKRHSTRGIKTETITSKMLVAGTVQSVQWLAMSWPTEGFEFESQSGQEFSLLYRIQSDHLNYYPMGTRGSFPKAKQPEQETNH